MGKSIILSMGNRSCCLMQLACAQQLIFLPGTTSKYSSASPGSTKDRWEAD